MNTPYESANRHSLKPREVLMNDDERSMLAAESEQAIEEILTNNPHRETVKTIGAIELNASILNAPSTEFAFLVGRVYDRAFVEATFEHTEATDEEFLSGAKIILFCEGKSPMVRSELIITANEHDDPDDMIEYLFDEHSFTLRTPRPGAEPDDVTPLSSSSCKSLLDGLVIQANEFQAIVNPERSFAESIRALLEVAGEREVQREGTYRVRPNAGDSFVDLSLSNRYIFINDPPRRIRSYHHALVETHQLLDKRDSARTSLEIRAGRRSINAIMGVDYDYYDDGNNNGEVYESLLNNVVLDFNEPRKAYPGKFTEQILRSLRLLNDTPPDYFIQVKD